MQATSFCNYGRKNAFSVLHVNILSYISTQKADLDEIKKTFLENFVLLKK